MILPSWSDWLKPLGPSMATVDASWQQRATNWSRQYDDPVRAWPDFVWGMWCAPRTCGRTVHLLTDDEAAAACPGVRVISRRLGSTGDRTAGTRAASAKVVYDGSSVG
jgi:hypothetical protein